MHPSARIAFIALGLAGCEARPPVDSGAAAPQPPVAATPAPATATASLPSSAHVPSAKQAPSDTMTHWTCDELGLMVRIAADGRQLVIDWSGARRVLPADPADATRYTDRDTAFEIRPDSARLQLEGDASRACIAAARASPWNAALLRGVAFRAVGNEPGWHVEIDRGETPALRAALDYGERELVLERSRRSGDTVRGTASGEDVELRIERRPCEDGMSGQRFEARATLRVGERAYTGCGAFLDD